jgi:hypothetical protein
MAQFTETFKTYEVVGRKEDVSEVITDISPEDTPFMSNVGRADISNTYFQWQTDALSAASSTNAVLEGDDITSGNVATATPTVMLANYAQISRKTVAVSGTLEATDRYGRGSELAYQTAKMGREIKRDMERILTGPQAANAGAAATARVTAGLEAFLRTNDDRGSGGTDPTLSGSTSGFPNAHPGDATGGNQRAFTETILKNVIQKVWASGGSPKILMVGPVNKQRVSTFTGIAGTRYNVKGDSPTTIIGAADVYVSDFGNVSVVPNRFQRERSAFVLDPEYASVAYLRNFQLVDLSKTGDAEKKMLVVEYGLKVDTESAHGIAADLTTT